MIDKNKIKILIACEYSGTVRKEFRRLGFDAWSCDILDSEDNSKHHIKDDVLKHIDNGWDLIIAHPPCTHLAVSGARHFKEKIKDGRQQQGIDFFMNIVDADCPRIIIENPICIMSTKYRKPDQIIQPWQFGDKFQKTTCLWIKGMPGLKHTKIVSKGEFITFPSGKRMSKWYSNKSGQGKLRSKTFPGIAKAMAEQWGKFLEEDVSFD